MTYGERQRYWITYNGELYNFRELRSELESDGFRFHSQSDTEVLLAMHARHGRDMLTRLRGIFAFAIWDTARGELFVARDRLGVKPLYYAQRRDGLFAFGSEIKAILPALPAPRLRMQSVAEFLTFLWVPDPDTMFEDIQKLAPGHYACYRDGRLTVAPYWDMSFAPDEASEQEWTERVERAVASAVRSQMISDVPLGGFLSGGIDSSAIVAEMVRSAASAVTYTVGFRSEDLAHDIVPDDLRHARRLAADMPVDYHEQTLEPNIVDLLPSLVWHMDEPVADPAAITTYLICRAARERLTVMLSGMGGDEIFAGYPRHLAAQLGRVADLVPIGARSALRQWANGRLTVGPPGRLRGPRRNAMKFLRGVDGSPNDRYLTYCSYYRRDELSAVLSDELRRALADHDPFQRHREYFGRVADQDWLNQLLYVDLKTFLPCLNLTYTDKMSMAASTEVRVPLLDDDLVELSGSIPPRLKLRRTTRKHVFKRSQEGRLPRSIIYRGKAGFGAPVRAWLSNDLRPLVDEMLSPSAISARGLLDPAEVQRIIHANDIGTEDNALRIWSMLTLELWQRQFLDAPSASARGST